MATDQPSPSSSERAVDRHGDVVEEDLGELRGAVHGLDRPHDDARAVHVDEQGGDALGGPIPDVPVRARSTQRSAYWARLVQTFWPVTLPDVAGPGGPARQRGQVASRSGLRKALAPGLVAPEEPRHHVCRQFRGGVVDHRRCQHLGHRVDARLDQIPGGQRFAQVGAEQRRTPEPADPGGPPPPHPSGLIGEPLDLGQLGHLVVQRPRSTGDGP